MSNHMTPSVFVTDAVLYNIVDYLPIDSYSHMMSLNHEMVDMRKLVCYQRPIAITPKTYALLLQRQNDDNRIRYTNLLVIPIWNRGRYQKSSIHYSNDLNINMPTNENNQINYCRYNCDKIKLDYEESLIVKSNLIANRFNALMVNHTRAPNEVNEYSNFVEQSFALNKSGTNMVRQPMYNVNGVCGDKIALATLMFNALQLLIEFESVMMDWMYYIMKFDDYNNYMDSFRSIANVQIQFPIGSTTIEGFENHDPVGHRFFIHWCMAHANKMFAYAAFTSLFQFDTTFFDKFTIAGIDGKSASHVIINAFDPKEVRYYAFTRFFRIKLRMCIIMSLVYMKAIGDIDVTDNTISDPDEPLFIRPEDVPGLIITPLNSPHGSYYIICGAILLCQGNDTYTIVQVMSGEVMPIQESLMNLIVRSCEDEVNKENPINVKRMLTYDSMFYPNKPIGHSTYIGIPPQNRYYNRNKKRQRESTLENDAKRQHNPPEQLNHFSAKRQHVPTEQLMTNEGRYIPIEQVFEFTEGMSHQVN